MSWVGVAQEMPDSPKIVAGLNKRAYTREFRVQVDSLADGPKTACSAPGIPRLYDPYVFGNESDDYALVRDIDADRMQGASLYWKVTVRYETPEPVNERGNSPSGTQHEQAGQHDNPLAMLAEVQSSTEKFREVIYSVYDTTTGTLTPCKNTAGQVFDPPPEKDATRLVLSITRNEAISVLHPAVDVIYSDAVNSDTWWGCPPGTWKCQGISTQRETKQLSSGAIFPYLRCTYKFEARPSWDLQILDAGSYSIQVFDVKRRKIQFKTDDGHPRIGALDGQGEELRDGLPPVYLTFRVYPRRPFGALNLPQSFAQCA